MQTEWLREIVLILGLSVGLILVFQRVRLPALLGFLLAGVVAGPSGFNLIRNYHEVELMAEIGIVFLLFIIGMEFSLKGLSSIKRVVFVGGSLQVAGTILATTGSAWLFGLPWRQAVFLGFLFSLSSTAIVLKMLQERGELASLHGRVSLGILIFQDLIVVPMMLVLPILAGEAENPWQLLGLLILKVLLVISVIALLARFVVPRVLASVVRTKSRELFILSIVVTCLATAWLTSSIGLSLALGAFFAGLVISESEYSHQATANILPFREIFISFFFVSIGMLLDVFFFFSHFLHILLLSAAVTLLKMLVLLGATRLLGYKSRTAWLSAFHLFQVGEFAFLLSAAGMKLDLLDPEVYQYFLAISIITMGTSPFLIAGGPQLLDRLRQSRLPGPLAGQWVGKWIPAMHGETAESGKSAELRDHLIIVGYGINGENVAKAARHADIPYRVIELDPEILRKAQAAGEPVLFGDATDSHILQHVRVQNARVVVIAISDPQATRKIVRAVRDFSETAYLIVRTRYVREIEENLQHGADEVIPEEFETSIEIFTRVLRQYLVAVDEIEAFVLKIRAGNYEMLRNLPSMQQPTGLHKLHIPDMEIATLPVYQGNNTVVGKSVGQVGLRKNYGVTILAIRRGEQYISEIHPETVIQTDDLLYVFGNPDNVTRLNKYFCLQ